jgi:hypothetical protein
LIALVEKLAGIVRRSIGLQAVMRLIGLPRDSHVSVGVDGVRCRQVPGEAARESDGATVDVSPDDILEELRRTLRRVEFAPFAQLLALPSVVGALYLALVEKAPVLAVAFGVVGAGTVLIGYLFLRELDRRRCVTRIFYETDEETARRFSELRQGFSRFAACRGVWFVPHGSRSPERAKEIGATAPLHRYRVRPDLSAPPRVASNLKVPTLHAGRVSFYFFPDRIYVYGTQRVSVLAYEDLVAQATRHHYMEDDEVPTDARIAGSTWRYVHPDGSKDLHYHNNYQVPIVIYGELRLTGPKGLDALYQCSQPDVVSPFSAALAGMSPGGQERRADRAEHESTVSSADETDESEDDSGERDSRFDEALAVAVSAGYASSSLFAKKLKLSFERASSIVAMMEEEGYVDPARGTEPRLVKQSARRCVELLERLSGNAHEPTSEGDARRTRARTGRSSGWRAAARATRSGAATDVLGVAPSASLDEIAAAYHHLAQLYHPDKVANLAPEFMVIAERRMREINAAYEELTRRQKA